MHVRSSQEFDVPFVTRILNHYTTESQDYFKRHNRNVCSVLAIAFIEFNPKYRELIHDIVLGKKYYENLIIDFVTEFDQFLKKFSNYKDIEEFFNNVNSPSEAVLHSIFKASAIYVDKEIPEDVQWTIESTERVVTSSLYEVQKIFDYCSKLVKQGCFSIDFLIEHFSSQHRQ